MINHHSFIPSLLAPEHQSHWCRRAKADANLNQYKKDYIDTGSAKPLYDVMIYGFILAYALAWPTEYMHYKHEQARCTPREPLRAVSE